MEKERNRYRGEPREAEIKVGKPVASMAHKWICFSPTEERGEALGISQWICSIPQEAMERLAQATVSTEFIVLGFLGQGFYLAWDLWHLLLMNVYS